MSAARVLERVDRLCREPLSAKALRERAVELIGRSVPNDGHVWLLTDPVSCVGTSPLADVPRLPWPRLPALARQRYLTTVNRWPELRASGIAAASLWDTTGGRPERSSLWREVLEPLGVTDVASAVFADRFGCWAWLDLWRCGTRFTAAEVDLLGMLTGPLTAAIRSALGRTFAEPPDVVGTDASGPAVVLLDERLHVLSQTTGAGAALRLLNPPGEAPVADPIPAAALNVAAALLATEAGVPVGPPWSRVHLGTGRWVTLRAERLADTQVAVTIEASTPAERRELVGLVHGLSPREREVLAHLSSGADSRAVAAALVLSEHTVHDHVRAVLAKTGTPTRSVLMSRIAGS